MEQMCSLNKEKRFFNATQEEVEKMVWNKIGRAHV